MQARAISPVIATLLLILIALAAAVLIYVWVTGYATGLTKAGAPELEEKIKIEAVSYDNSSGKFIVYIRNIGDTTVEITDIYVIEAKSNEVKYRLTFTYATIDPGTVSSFGDANVTDNEVDHKPTDSVDVVLNEGITYIIKAVTKTGVEASTSFSYQK